MLQVAKAGAGLDEEDAPMRRAAFRRWLTGVKRVTAAENEGGPGPVGATAEAILPADTQITDLDWAKQENLQHLSRSPDSLDATPICCQNRQHDSKTDHPFLRIFLRKAT